MTNYRFEYNGNTEYVTVHTTERLLDNKLGFVSSYDDIQIPEIAELHNLLRSSDGVEEVSLRTYSITAKRGAAFERDAVLTSMLKNLQVWLSLNRGIQLNDWKQLPTLRSDIGLMQCFTCMYEQNAEMARSMRDFDTLEY